MEHGNGTTSPQPSPRALAERHTTLHTAAALTLIIDLRTQHNLPLTPAEQAHADQELATAHAHGHTDRDIHAYIDTHLQPTVPQ